jgi:hypothetical protein
MTYLKAWNVVNFDTTLTHCMLKGKLYNHLSKLIDRLGSAAERADKTQFNSIIADQFLVLGILADIDNAQANNSPRIRIIEQQKKIFEAIDVEFKLF